MKTNGWLFEGEEHGVVSFKRVTDSVEQFITHDKEATMFYPEGLGKEKPVYMIDSLSEGLNIASDQTGAEEVRIHVAPAVAEKVKTAFKNQGKVLGFKLGDIRDDMFGKKSKMVALFKKEK